MNSRNDQPLIRSISNDQDELLKWILQLYVPDGRFDADPTYSKGGFYKHVSKPVHCMDIQPLSPHVTQTDCRKLPFADGELKSMMLDLPFLATTGELLNTSHGNIINRRFTVCPSEKELAKLYRDALIEAHRVLSKGGVLVFKCQDKVSSAKQYMMHCLVYNWATELGFVAEDLFILLARSRLIANWQRKQKHARKYHSYFWVFRKR